MVNHRLRRAITISGLTQEELARELKVNPKTVERWITKAHVPYPRNRHSLSELLGKPEPVLWPELFKETDGETIGAGADDVVRIHPQRSSIPNDVWRTLFTKATKRIDLLDYAGLFLVELHPDLVGLLADKAAAGTAVRLLLGDPHCPAVAVRGQDEGTGDGVGATILDALHHFRALTDQSSVAVRFHDTTLYSSIYQFDDEMVVTTHVYGLPAAHAPTLHLRRRPGSSLFDTYVMSFERVWQNATPSWPTEI
jgi:transcriptional regulator with XRE-family HTH domain